TVLRPWARGTVGGKWAAAAALLAATWTFHCTMPSSREPRHMVMALPALAMFVAAGLAAAAGGAAARGRHAGRAPWVVAGLAVAVFLANGFAVPTKSWSGFSAPADLLLRAPAGAPAVMLVVSDVRGEGMFISEMAAREPRPRRTILRGSKALAES